MGSCTAPVESTRSLTLLWLNSTEPRRRGCFRPKRAPNPNLRCQERVTDPQNQSSNVWGVPELPKTQTSDVCQGVPNPPRGLKKP